MPSAFLPHFPRPSKKNMLFSNSELMGVLASGNTLTSRPAAMKWVLL